MSHVLGKHRLAQQLGDRVLHIKNLQHAQRVCD
jgi:hypothetical protein